MGWQSNIFNQVIVEGNNAGVFIYGASGQLIGSWAAQAGTDSFGNSYPAGINVQQGSISGVGIQQSSFIAGTILNTLISASQIQSSQFNGGQIFESVITFDSTAGGLFMYSTTTNTFTFNSGGLSTYTPSVAAVTNIRVQCWGADASGGGGNATGGGEAGGGGGYGEEPQYPVVFGTNYNVNVGLGGPGQTTGNSGVSGGNSQFDGTGVTGNGGNAGASGVGGLGGAISANSITHAGGNGGSNPSNFAASAGGGGRAGATGNGGNGGNPTGNASPGAGGIAGTGGGGIAGGAGVASGANGSNGGGGSGAGAATSSTNISKTYRPTESASYYGSEKGQGRRNVNGAMYQGCAQGELSTTGDQYSIAVYNQSQINSDFSGATITSVSAEVTNAHSWYNSGQYLIFGYASFQTLGGTGNLSGASLNKSAQFISEGGTETFNLPSAFRSEVQSGNFGCLILGPSKSTAGGATDLWNYGFQNGGPSFGPVLTIKGTTGSGSATAGSGSDGEIIITETASSALIGALSPVAGTDANGNDYAIGYTGTVQAFQPGSSPLNVEGWHPITPPAGWSGTAQYRAVAENGAVYIDIVLGASAQGAKTNFTFGSVIPADYLPKRSIALPLQETNNTAAAAPYPSLFINGSTGAVTAFHIDVGTTGIDVHETYYTI